MSQTFCQYDLTEHTDEEYVALFAKYVIKHNAIEIEAILRSPDSSKHFGVALDWVNILQYHVKLGTLLLAYPRHLLPLLDDAIREVEKAILSLHREGKQKDTGMNYKQFVHGRIFGLSFSSIEVQDSGRCPLPTSNDIGKLISIKGTVIRTNDPKIIEKQKEMKCISCQYIFTVYADPETEGNLFPKISKCPSAQKKCKGRNFIEIAGSSVVCNYQEIKIQEPIQQLGMGTIPKSIVIILESEMVDTCQPGDDVTIVGIAMRRWKLPIIDGERSQLTIFMVANHMRVNNERRFNSLITEELKSEYLDFWQKHKDKPLTGRNLIVQSVCPQVYGMHVVKLGFLMALIGGVPEQKKGMSIRGECHILLVGEPGTGKSQFLKFGCKLGNRSVMTTGTGTSSAGLTVTAIKGKSGEWMLEAGALVLADGGVCCIDEFGAVKAQDRATIHEAMEQQTISVAKAGIICKLNTRCTIIGATNPKGTFDNDETLDINLAIKSSLLSRFDLIFILLDEKNREWDKVVSSFILSGHPPTKNNLWELEKVKTYISLVKTFYPRIESGSKAQIVLTKYYTFQRQRDERDQSRTTIRLLESLVRLAQAHARLMFHSTVELIDAIVTIVVFEASMASSALSGVQSALRSVDNEDPDLKYKEEERNILKKLGLSSLIEDDNHNFGNGRNEKNSFFNSSQSSSSSSFLSSPSSSQNGNVNVNVNVNNKKPNSAPSSMNRLPSSTKPLYNHQFPSQSINLQSQYSLDHQSRPPSKAISPNKLAHFSSIDSEPEENNSGYWKEFSQANQQEFPNEPSLHPSIIGDGEREHLFDVIESRMQERSKATKKPDSIKNWFGDDDDDIIEEEFKNEISKDSNIHDSTSSKINLITPPKNKSPFFISSTPDKFINLSDPNQNSDTNLNNFSSQNDSIVNNSKKNLENDNSNKIDDPKSITNIEQIFQLSQSSDLSSLSQNVNNNNNNKNLEDDKILKKRLRNEISSSPLLDDSEEENFDLFSKSQSPKKHRSNFIMDEDLPDDDNGLVFPWDSITPKSGK